MQFTAQQIAPFVSGEIIGSPDVQIHDVSPIEQGIAGTLSYVTDQRFLPALASTKASVVLDDARDGLFLACWKIKDKRLHAKLLRKFEEWFTKDETWGGGTGEDDWLRRFISKWLTEGTFTYARLEKCIRWHFKHSVI